LVASQPMPQIVSVGYNMVPPFLRTVRHCSISFSNIIMHNVYGSAKVYLPCILPQIENLIKMKKIIVDCERMRHKYTGLYSFCKQLSLGILKLKRPDEQLNLYVPGNEVGFAGDTVEYIKQQ